MLLFLFISKRIGCPFNAGQAPRSLPTMGFEMHALKFIRSSLMQIDLLATTKRGVALKDVIDHFCGMQRGRAEPLLLPVGARYSR